MNKWTIFHGYAAMLNNQMVNMECDKETLGLHKQIWQPLFRWRGSGSAADSVLGTFMIHGVKNQSTQSKKICGY